MANPGLGDALRRREVLRYAATAGGMLWAEAYAFAASDFWDKKKPSEWTDQEKEELRTKSPWAKKVDGEMTGGGGGAAPGGGGDDSGGGGGGGSKRGGGGGRGGGLVPDAPGGGGRQTSLELVWVSARPVQDAHPLDFGTRLANHYVISVTGIPTPTLNAAIRGGARGGSGARGGRFGGRAGENGDQVNAGPPPAPADPTAALKRGSTLVVKGKDPQNPDVVLSMNNNATLLFGFAKDSLPLTVADKEVEFELKLGNLTAKAKFTLKDMMYNGELAV